MRSEKFIEARLAMEKGTAPIIGWGNTRLKWNLFLPAYRKHFLSIIKVKLESKRDSIRNKDYSTATKTQGPEEARLPQNDSISGQEAGAEKEISLANFPHKRPRASDIFPKTAKELQGDSSATHDLYSHIGPLTLKKSKTWGEILIETLPDKATFEKNNFKSESTPGQGSTCPSSILGDISKITSFISADLDSYGLPIGSHNDLGAPQ